MTATPDDSELLARARIGDRTAFDALVAPHRSPLRSFLHRLVRPRAAARGRRVPRQRPGCDAHWLASGVALRLPVALATTPAFAFERKRALAGGARSARARRARRRTARRGRAREPGARAGTGAISTRRNLPQIPAIDAAADEQLPKISECHAAARPSMPGRAPSPVTSCRAPWRPCPWRPCRRPRCPSCPCTPWPRSRPSPCPCSRSGPSSCSRRRSTRPCPCTH